MLQRERAKLFESYLFADYSGALTPKSQRASIRLAEATPMRPARPVPGRFTRAER